MLLPCISTERTIARDKSCSRRIHSRGGNSCICCGNRWHSCITGNEGEEVTSLLLAKLHTPLIVGIDRINHALDEDNMFIECDERTNNLRSKTSSQNRRGWPISWHDLVVDQFCRGPLGSNLCSSLTKSKNLGLCEEVAHEEVMHGAGAVSCGEIIEWLCNSDKVGRNKTGALMQ